MNGNDVAADAIAELTRKARDAVKAAQAELAEKEAATLEARRITRELERELESIESAARRYFPTSTDEIPSLKNPVLVGSVALDLDFASSKPEGDWVAMKRADAVMKAVRHLAAGSDGYATPDSIQRFLIECGRDDDKNGIGSTLSRLRSNELKVRRIASGKWVPTDTAEVSLL